MLCVSVKSVTILQLSTKDIVDWETTQRPVFPMVVAHFNATLRHPVCIRVHLFRVSGTLIFDIYEFNIPGVLVLGSVNEITQNSYHIDTSRMETQ